MRPISLQLEAFGPYLDRTFIDFEKLNEAGLFLITGSTGGGKTTLLDAMCIALYNSSTGRKRSFSDMRSLAADNTQRTEVTFTFSLGGERYRFCRALYMKKKRGSDVYVQHDQHECYRLNGDDWELVVSGAAKTVTDFAQSLLHLTVEQFSQVIVLPQGDFLRLLMANSNEKGEILKTLFACENWKNLIIKLTDRQRSIAAKRHDSETLLNSLLEKHGAKTLPELTDQIGTLKKQKEDTEQRLQEESQKLLSTQELLKSVLAFEQLVKEKQTAEKLRQDAVLELSNAKTAMQDTAQTEERIAELQKKRMETERQLEALRQERKQSAEKEETEKSLSALDRRIKTLRSDMAAAEQTKADVLQKIVVGEEYLAGITQAAEAIPALLTEKTKLEEQRRNLEEAAAAQHEYNSLLKELNEKKDTALREKLTMTAQHKAVSSAEAARMAHSAAALAADLEDGEPCPVCGSVHHPALAHSRENAVTEDELNAMREQLERFRAKYNAAENAVSAAKAKTDIAAERLAKTQEACKAITESTDTLLSKLSTVAENLADAEKKVSNRQKAQVRLQNLRTQAADAEQKLSECAAQLAAGEAQQEQLTVHLTAYTHVRTVAEIDKRINAADAESASLDSMCSKLEHARRTAAERFAAAEQQMRTAEKRYVLSVDAITAFGKPPEISSASVSEMQHVLQAETNRLSVLRGSLTQALDAAVKTETDIRVLTEKTAELDTAYSRITRLHGLLSGQKNTLRMPILQYVLSMMLDETIFSANRFFSIFSRGRYALRRMDVPKSGSGYSGLDIEVLDGMNGTCRSLNTLSGGEQFLASLSLAFGLSEVVQANSGVVRMDSIFIDEGFGSLDGDTLDTAMKALETIRQSGRVVGIISHVSELRQRIPTMIRVSQKEGSATAKVISE